MALGSVLVDRGRVLRNEPSPNRVGGTTYMAETAGAWFRCRLTLPGTAETDAPGGATGQPGPHRVVRTPTLMMKALRGANIEPEDRCPVKASDRVEVDSRAQGRAVWRVTGAPTPFRKKRTVIGFEVTLERVEEQGFQRGPA